MYILCPRAIHIVSLPKQPLSEITPIERLNLAQLVAIVTRCKHHVGQVINNLTLCFNQR